MCASLTSNHILIFLVHLVSICRSTVLIPTITHHSYNKQIICDKNENCVISCNHDKNLCSNTIIQCPQNNQCNITCSNTNSCQKLIINAHSSSLLILNINPLIPSNISIHFPHNKINNNPHQLQINPLSINNSDPSSKLHLNIYTKHGWKDINISEQNTSHYINIHGTIFCKYTGSTYDANCDFSYFSSSSCMDKTHICNQNEPILIQKLCSLCLMHALYHTPNMIRRTQTPKQTPLHRALRSHQRHLLSPTTVSPINLTNSTNTLSGTIIHPSTKETQYIIPSTCPISICF